MMSSPRVLLFAVCTLFLLCAVDVSASSASASLVSIPAESRHASPVSAPILAANGAISDPVANPLLAPQPKAKKEEKKAGKKKVEKYTKPTDFMGGMGGVPMNPVRHLQRVLAEDKKYIAAILRAPIDVGDPAACTHKDIARDKLALKQIALRVNHRRIALKQQQHWIDHATEALKRLEGEIASTTSTAKNLAEQLDALQQQKSDIVNHVNRDVLLKELDRTSSNLMRLKNRRMADEVGLQAKHNKFAIQNHQHNQVLARLHKMRTEQGLELGYLEDPKPYRFQQVEANQEQEMAESALAEVQQAAESENQAEAEVEADSKADLAGEQEHAAEAEAAPEAEQQ